jgi:hypothetical protein
MKPRTWDILSILGLVSICCLGVVFTSIAMNPNSSLNPFPPPTMPALLDLPSSTPTLRSLPSTWTPTSPDSGNSVLPTQTLPPTRTGWVMPTFTSTPTNTPTRTNTPTITKTPTETRRPSATRTKKPTDTESPDLTATCEALGGPGTPCP